MAYMIVSLHQSGENTSVPKRSTDLISIVSRKKLCLAIFMIWDIFLYRVCPHKISKCKVTWRNLYEELRNFFLEEETHLMHSNCCASASFLIIVSPHVQLTDDTHIFLCKHSITINRKIVNHAIANAVIWVEFAVVGHAWSITTKQYYECCSDLSWSWYLLQDYGIMNDNE